LRSNKYVDSQIDDKMWIQTEKIAGLQHVDSETVSKQAVAPLRNFQDESHVSLFSVAGDLRQSASAVQVRKPQLFLVRLRWSLAWTFTRTFGHRTTLLDFSLLRICIILNLNPVHVTSASALVAGQEKSNQNPINRGEEDFSCYFVHGARSATVSSCPFYMPLSNRHKI